MALLDWLKDRSSRIFDPRQEQRLNELADQVWLQISAQRRAFNFEQTMASLGAFVEDNPLVAQRVYEKALRKAWKDETVTDVERKSLDVIGQLLHLDPQKRRQAEWQAGVAAFELALGVAIADGQLDDAEAARLSRIAGSMDTSVRELMKQYLGDRGGDILQSFFAGVLSQKGTFSAEDWQRLVRAAAGFGMTETELQAAIRPQAERVVERVLADAKADRDVSPQEREALRWLMGVFGLSPAFQKYVNEEVAAVDRFSQVVAGRLPSVQAPGIALRAGEIVHVHRPAAYSLLRQRRGGARTESHEGVVTISDTRLIFSSATKTVDIGHRRIVSLIPIAGGVELRAGGKPGGWFYFSGDTELTTAIYQTAVGKANQTITEQNAGVPTRHIARDVRQRVWQRYSGCCADCGADQYLEFDHIVPVAKGGSNTEANVQLLCRGCNLKKSDQI